MLLGFKPWPKTPRWYRSITVTEKIDGTNAAVGIAEYPRYDAPESHIAKFVPRLFTPDSGQPDYEYLVYAQSRKRIITPDSDNYGFAQWVWDHAESLVADLGPGLHFGEWWGKGIQRGYGVPDKRLSLFNTTRFGFDRMSTDLFATPGLGTVPVLYQGENDARIIETALLDLRESGSYVAAPGWSGQAEGICIWHSAANQVFKVTLEEDCIPKTLRLEAA